MACSTIKPQLLLRFSSCRIRCKGFVKVFCTGIANLAHFLLSIFLPLTGKLFLHPIGRMFYQKKMCMKFFSLLLVVVVMLVQPALAQPGRWQQRIQYVMDVDVDTLSNQFNGTQKITYTNNSNDTLGRIFMHLYWNAFKPGSEMDVHSRSTENIIVGKDTANKPVTDFDKRFQVRVADLAADEQGWCHVKSVMVNGKALRLQEHETILEITLDKPLAPKQSLVMNTVFNCRVPKMSRRSGRDSKQNIRYSIGQWYPKVVEYDEEGWHADPYVAREFYGVWGDFDVTIRIDSSYKLGGTGILVNAAQIGWGYDKEGTPLKPIATAKRAWHFVGKNIHDFVWAADAGYQHISRKVSNNRMLHIIYKTEPEKWKAVADTAVLALPFIEKTFGAYPYPQYSFIHAGGGATEYPMATLMNTPSVTTALHEWMHSWYQGMMGTNENLYAWMDEGFTTYAETRTTAWLRKSAGFVYEPLYKRYYSLAASKFDEPMCTHANFFATNYAYNNNSYFKGAVLLEQLGYIVGAPVRDKILLNYYKQWRFKHPNPNDFIRVAETTSGMELDWYKEYWVNTTKSIDYSIDSVWINGSTTQVRVKRLGDMPMPLDVLISFKDGSNELHYVPLDMMYGKKAAETAEPRTVYAAQPWTHREILIGTTRKLTDIISIEIDPSLRMADTDRKNNKLQLKW